MHYVRLLFVLFHSLCNKIHLWWHCRCFFTLNKFIVKEQKQCTPLKTVADRYKKHFIIINKIMKHSNDTGHSLTVCTKSHMVFTLMVYSFLSGPWAKLLPASPHIWLFKLYLMPGKLNLNGILKEFEVDRFNWSLALCSDLPGSTGLANRASVLACGIFSDKWTVLIEFSFTVCVVDQAVSADAVSHRVIASQGTQAAALQWLLFAVTAINNNREGWPGSAVHHIDTSGGCSVATHGTLRGRVWHTSTHTMSHITESICTCTYRPCTVHVDY